MKKLKKKAVFYAYSNNALDHLAPYVFLCNQKNIECAVVYGEDFIRRKVYPNKKIVKIFENNKINIHNIPFFEKKGFIKSIFYYVWLWTEIIEKKSYIPNFFKIKLKGLCERIYNILDGDKLGANTAKKLLKNSEKVLVFTDNCNEKKIKKSFLLQMRNHAKIITTGHAVWQQDGTLNKEMFAEDITLVSNKWEASSKSNKKNIEIIGSLRYSKNWLKILDDYSPDSKIVSNKRKNIVVLMSPVHVTSDWKTMINTLTKIIKCEDTDVKILPHIRDMINMKPPIELKDNWDKKSYLDFSVKNSDIVVFWGSSGIFEAVARNKKIFFLSYLDLNKNNYFWMDQIINNTIIDNDFELLEAIKNFKRDSIENNESFKKIIWPNNDPWLNATNLINKII
tara:strand:+ start:918 stop:2102 length:1185 start_codon:yes stop_codon:yes gene_type:complete